MHDFSEATRIFLTLNGRNYSKWIGFGIVSVIQYQVINIVLYWYMIMYRQIFVNVLVCSSIKWASLLRSNVPLCLKPYMGLGHPNDTRQQKLLLLYILEAFSWNQECIYKWIVNWWKKIRHQEILSKLRLVFRYVWKK